MHCVGPRPSSTLMSIQGCPLQCLPSTSQTSRGQHKATSRVPPLPLHTALDLNLKLLLIELRPALLTPHAADSSVLFMMCKLATTPETARIALSAFAAVRASIVRQGRAAPYDDKLAAAFVDVRNKSWAGATSRAYLSAAEAWLVLGALRQARALRTACT